MNTLTFRTLSAGLRSALSGGLGAVLGRTLIVVLMALAAPASATHFSGGEIYWECIGPNQFRISLVVYRDCAGIQVDPSNNLRLTSPCGTRTLNVTTPGGVEISQLCDLELPNSTCNGGSLPGIQQYIYTGIITLPPCDSWTISWTNIYRNNAIVNLTNPGTREMYITGVLNSAAAPCNDSPTFTNTAIPYVCLGYPVSYSYGAVDVEADSLSYSLIGARMLNGNPVPYVPPYSGATPIPGLTLDPVSGLVNFTLNVQGNWVVVVQVTQYDAAGNVIGTIMRDMQFVAYPCSNIPPDAATGLITNLSGTATQTGPRSIQVCESGNFCFDMVIADVNLTNVLDAFSNVAMNLPGSTFSFTGTNPITATVCWTASAGTSGYFPFIVNVDDGACPIPAFQTYVYSVNVLPGIFANVTSTPESCVGLGNGSATANVTVGEAPFSYAWSTGATGPGITGAAGPYSVVVTDANGCISQPLGTTIGAGPTPPTADAGDDLVGCAGAFPVAISGSIGNASGHAWGGGTGTFSGTGLSTGYTPSAAELAAGSVILTLTANGSGSCPPATDQVTIQLPNSFASTTVSATDVLCAGGSTGTASVEPAVPGHTYLWSDPATQATPTATGLAAGPYSVTITDGFGCAATFNTTVGSVAPVSIVDLSSTDEPCLGAGGGTASVTVAGGTAPYTYVWSNGTNGPGIIASAGNYTVTVTDANGCAPATGSVTIAATGIPNVADAGDDLVGCAGTFPIMLNGTVTNATGGSWSGGTGIFTGSGLSAGYTPSAGELAAGSVILTLTTTGNSTCPPAQDQVVIMLPNSFANTGISSEDAICFGTATGSASVTPADPGFSYLWNDPAAQITPTATALGAGSYSVLITDGFGCSIELSTIVGPTAALSIADISSTNESCLGTGDGTATVTITGGTAPYSYSWSNGANGATIIAGAGNYTVTVTDANGCAPATGDITIGVSGLPNLADAGDDLVGCTNSFPIAIEATITNATGASWSGGAGVYLGGGTSIAYHPTTAEILAGGVTLVVTTTGNGTCPPDQDSVFIALSNSFLNSSLSVGAPRCTGSVDGTIVYAPELPGLTYQWSDAGAQTSATASGLGAGTYTITVTDALGCDTTLAATLLDPSALVVDTITSTPVTCSNGNDGSLMLQVVGGTPAYTVTWGNGANGVLLGNLSAGAYTATVVDANGCITTAQGMVTSPAPIQLAAVGPDTVCVNAPAVFSASAQGGTGSYVFTWSGLGSGPQLTAAFNQSQTLTVSATDSNGCTSGPVQLPVTVLNLNTANFTTYGDTTVCEGGSATYGVQFSGYAGDWSLSWTPGIHVGMGPFSSPVTEDRELAVTIMDQCGNSITRTISIQLDEAPELTLPTVIAQGCAPLQVPFPAMQLPAGTQYLWSLGNGQTSTQQQPNITYNAGSYAVGLSIVTPFGCTHTAPGTGQVVAFAPPTADFVASTYRTTADNATIQFTDQSNGNGLSHSWLMGDGGTSNIQNPEHTYEDMGTFEVELTVVDLNGCSAQATALITIDAVYDITIPTAFTPNSNGGNGGAWTSGDLSNDVFYPFARFVDEFRMRIFNRWGELVFESTDIQYGWDGYYRNELSPQDVYMVQTWVKFLDGKQITKLTDLTLFR
jgi:PKD repeat protein